MLLQAYFPDLYKSLGIFIPLIVVNCIILARAEAFASKNGPFASLLDGLGMGLGFTVSLTLISAIRQVLGSVLNIGFFTLPPGGFLVLGLLLAAFGVLSNKGGKDK